MTHEIAFTPRPCGNTIDVPLRSTHITHLFDAVNRATLHDHQRFDAYSLIHGRETPVMLGNHWLFAPLHHPFSQWYRTVILRKNHMYHESLDVVDRLGRAYSWNIDAAITSVWVSFQRILKDDIREKVNEDKGRF